MQKKIHTYLGCVWAIVALMIATTGCDVIDAPYKETTGSGPDTTKHLRKILLEDYTGAKCPNCPEAADIAKELQAAFPGQIIVMSVHAGYYAKPDPIPPFNYDFRNETATDLTNFFKIPEFPSGMTNRMVPAGASSRPLGRDAWAAAVNDMLNADADLSIDIENSYAAATRTVTVNVDLEYFNAQDADNYLAVYVLEDSIVKPQVDNRKTDPYVLDYVHNHVLRGAVNGKWWGERLGETAIEAGTTIQRQYTIQLGADWDAKHCKILAYVHKYDPSYDPVAAGGNGFEVLQVEEAHIVE